MQRYCGHLFLILDHISGRIFSKWWQNSSPLCSKRSKAPLHSHIQITHLLHSCCCKASESGQSGKPIPQSGNRCKKNFGLCSSATQYSHFCIDWKTQVNMKTNQENMWLTKAHWKSSFTETDACDAKSHLMPTPKVILVQRNAAENVIENSSNDSEVRISIQIW